jgi:predicted O-methyltransferase YrrM
VIWWSKLNLEEIYQNFLGMIKHKHLENFCRTWRTTSLKAAANFADGSIDILHIDGNHTSALEDVLTWLPKIKKGGYLWFDDANWHETKPAVQYLMEYCSWDQNRSVNNRENCCYLYQKN